MLMYQWELSDQAGNKRIGQSSDAEAETIRHRLEGNSFIVHYVLDVTQGRQIAGTIYVCSETLADTTIAAELVQGYGVVKS